MPGKVNFHVEEDEEYIIENEKKNVNDNLKSYFII